MFRPIYGDDVRHGGTRRNRYADRFSQRARIPGRRARTVGLQEDQGVPARPAEGLLGRRPRGDRGRDGRGGLDGRLGLDRRGGRLAVARVDGRLVGAIRIQRLDADLGEFGMLVASPDHRGSGVGRDLVAFAEDRARQQGLDRMQLELLVPRMWTHPVKEFLRGWYTRIGYVEVRTEGLAEAYPALQPLLATPCDFVVYHKDLRR